MSAGDKLSPESHPNTLYRYYIYALHVFCIGSADSFGFGTAVGAHVALHSRWEVRSGLAGGILYLSARKYIVIQLFAVELSLGPWAGRHVCSRVIHFDICGRVTYVHNYGMNFACIAIVL